MFVGIQRGGVDRQLATQEIEERDKDFATNFPLRAVERLVPLPPLLVVLRRGVDVVVFHAKIPRLLQIRHAYTPTALQIAEEEIPKIILQRVFGAVRGASFRCGVFLHIVLGFQRERLEDSIGQIFRLNPLVPRLLKRATQPRA